LAAEPSWLLEEVVVTARKREENMQALAQSVSSIDALALENAIAKDLRDLASYSPNLIIDDSSSGPGSPASISLRGVSMQDVEKSFEPAIGVALDGMFIGTNTGQMLQLIDIERVEILRGPQGTLFGRNSIGGVIHAIRSQPSGELGGKLRLRVGDFRRGEVDGLLNFAINERLAVKLTASHRRQEGGYFDNQLTGAQDGAFHYQSLAANLLYNLGQRQELEYTFQREWDDSEAPPLVNMSQPGSLLCDTLKQCAQLPDQPQTGDRRKNNQDGSNNAFIDTDSHLLEWRLELNEHYRLDYLFGLRDSDESSELDFDASPIDFFRTLRPQQYRQSSHELRLNYAAGDINLTGGLYHWHSEYHIQQTTHVNAAPTNKSARQQTDSWAVFFEGDYTLNDKLTATLGARYTHEDKSSGHQFPGVIDNIDQPVQQQWQNVSPKLALRYRFDAERMAYITLASGFRSGGFNGRPASISAALQPYNPETNRNLEVGLKSDWLGRRLRVNAAYFYMQYEDKQEEINRPAPSAVGQETVVANVATATISGLELELTALPLPGLMLRTNLGLLDANYDEFLADTNGDGNITDNSSLLLRRAPELTLALNVTYEWQWRAGTAWVQGNMHYLDKHETAFFNTVNTRNPSMSLFNASLNYELTGLRLSLFGRNLSDEEGWQHAFDVAGLFAFAAPRAPRTLGVEISKTFE